MTFRTRGRRLAARLQELERVSSAAPRTIHYIFCDEDGAYEVITARPGKPSSTTYLRDEPQGQTP